MRRVDGNYEMREFKWPVEIGGTSGRWAAREARVGFEGYLAAVDATGGEVNVCLAVVAGLAFPEGSSTIVGNRAIAANGEAWCGRSSSIALPLGSWSC